MDQIYFCSELGVREPGSQPRGKRTRADWGSWEERGKVGEAGSNLAKLASSQTSAESQARGNSYCGNREEPIWEPGKRKEAVKDTQCRARVLIPESQVATMMLDESPRCPGLQTARLPNSRSGWAFLARSFALLEFWFLMENSEEKKKVFLFIISTSKIGAVFPLEVLFLWCFFHSLQRARKSWFQAKSDQNSLVQQALLTVPGIKPLWIHRDNQSPCHHLAPPQTIFNATAERERQSPQWPAGSVGSCASPGPAFPTRTQIPTWAHSCLRAFAHLVPGCFLAEGH